MPGCAWKVKDDLEHVIMPVGVALQTEGLLAGVEDVGQRLYFSTELALW